MQIYVVFIFAFYIYYMLHCIIDVVKEEREYRSKRHLVKKQQTAEKAQQDLMHRVKQSEGYKEALLNRVTGTLPIADILADSDEQIQSPRYGYASQLIVTDMGNLLEHLAVCPPPEIIWEVYLELLTALDPVVAVMVVERQRTIGRIMQHLAYHKDLPVVRSVLLDYEGLLVKDGNMGIIVYDEATGEVHLTYHKDILVYAEDADPFRDILYRCGIREENEPVFVLQVPHIHVSSDESYDAMEILKSRIGIDQSVVTSSE